MVTKNKLIKKLKTEQVAQILVEAFIYGDAQAAKNSGLTTRQVRNYRSQLKQDDLLIQDFQHKKELAVNNWAEQLPETILAGMHFLKRAAQEADPKDPNVIHAITGSIKILTELQIFKDFINVRYGTESSQLGTEVRQLDSIPSRIED